MADAIRGLVGSARLGRLPLPGEVRYPSTAAKIVNCVRNGSIAQSTYLR
jgi:hypothetical protein